MKQKMKQNNTFRPDDWPVHMNTEGFSEYLAAQGVKKTKNTLQCERFQRKGFSYKKVGGRVYYHRATVQKELDRMGREG